MKNVEKELSELIAIDMDDLMDKFDGIWQDRISEMKDRVLMLRTGRGGAMLQHQWLLEEGRKFELGRELNEAEMEDIKKQVSKLPFEDGIYETNSKTGILEYKGCWNPDRENGVYGVKRHGRFYIELWYEGWRKEYKIVNELEYERFKKVKDFDFIDYFKLNK